MSSEQVGRQSAWYSVGIADVLFVFLAICILVTSRYSMLDDPGMGWHIRNIDAMWETGSWLHKDPFTFMRDSERWYANQWLGDLVIRGSFGWGGLEGIGVVAALALALVYRCLYMVMRRDGLPWAIAVVWTCLAAFCTSASWVARPNIATVGFVLLIARICVLFHEGRCSKRWTLWVLPVFTIWANTHGGFMAGIVILAATMLIETAIGFFGLEPEVRQEARGRALHFGFLLAGSFLFTLINPYGFMLYPFIFELLGNEYFMNLHQEWLSPNFHEPGAYRFELLFLLFPTILVFTRYRPGLVAIGLSILWLHFSFASVRYIALWAMISIPLMARSFMDITWMKRMISPLTKEASLRSTWVVSVVAAVVMLVWARYETEYAAIHQEHIAVDACDFLLEHYEGQTVYHDYNWGGYLIWKGWEGVPRIKNWIDDRNEVQGEAHVRDHFRILHAETGWEQRLKELGISLICIRPDTPLARMMIDPKYHREQAWIEIYRDEFAVIFEKERPGEPVTGIRPGESQ